MELQKAFDMKMDYHGKAEPIRVDEEGFICLTDLNKYFPTKRVRDWEVLGSTKDFLETVEQYLNSEDSRSLKLIKKKRGRYDGGTYAHQLIAFEFCTWLSTEFKL
ncbi:MAG: KilA-N domain-containing protein, partial [bacterium]|nr:KilA-N domain-containing protein [bacterium]